MLCCVMCCTHAFVLCVLCLCHVLHSSLCCCFCIVSKCKRTLFNVVLYYVLHSCICVVSCVCVMCCTQACVAVSVLLLNESKHSSMLCCVMCCTHACVLCYVCVCYVLHSSLCCCSCIVSKRKQSKTSIAKPDIRQYTHIVSYHIKLINYNQISCTTSKSKGTLQSCVVFCVITWACTNMPAT